MFVGNHHCLNVSKMGIALFLLLLCVACTTAVKTDDPFSNGRLLAENSVLKKRLPLVERENDVLNKENSQYRSKIRELESRVKQLDMELTALNVKYSDDMAVSAEAIRRLQQSIESKEKESAARIEQMQSLNAVLEKKRTQEVQALNDQITSQKESFTRERELLILENGRRTTQLSDQLEDLKKTIKDKDLELSSYKLAIGEISTRLGEATALAEDMKKARDASMAELASVKAAHADLINKVAASAHAVSVPERQIRVKH